MSGKKQKRGPEPERLKIELDWESAVKKALDKQRPEEGWPEPDQKRARPRRRDKSKASK